MPYDATDAAAAAVIDADTDAFLDAFAEVILMAIFMPRHATLSDTLRYAMIYYAIEDTLTMPPDADADTMLIFIAIELMMLFDAAFSFFRLLLR